MDTETNKYKANLCLDAYNAVVAALDVVDRTDRVTDEMKTGRLIEFLRVTADGYADKAMRDRQVDRLARIFHRGVSTVRSTATWDNLEPDYQAEIHAGINEVLEFLPKVADDALTLTGSEVSAIRVLFDAVEATTPEQDEAKQGLRAALARLEIPF